jgi:hypothetical protein
MITEFNKQKAKGKFWGLGRVVGADVIRQREEQEQEKVFREIWVPE